MESMSRPAVTSSAPARGLQAYLLMVQWEFLSLVPLLPFFIIVQFLIGGGMVIGFSFLFEDIPREQALYLCTGGSIMALLMVGFIAAPQIVAQYKTAKTYDFMLSLPIARPIMALAGLTVWMLIALPGMILALTAANLWYELDLQVSLLIAPAALLTVLMATSVGLAFAHAISRPEATILITQILAFGILVFSPINYPAERLPMWLQALHEFLPFQHAAAVIRGALTTSLEQDVGRSYAILAAWTAISWVVTLWVLNRRR
jgi:ABC-2 type transport system permease protein